VAAALAQPVPARRAAMANVVVVFIGCVPGGIGE
jgi:hypothetical protein